MNFSKDRAVQNALDSRSADGSASELSLKLADYQNYNLKTKMIRQEVENIASDLPSVLLMYILQVSKPSTLLNLTPY